MHHDEYGHGHGHAFLKVCMEMEMEIDELSETANVSCLAVI